MITGTLHFLYIHLQCYIIFTGEKEKKVHFDESQLQSHEHIQQGKLKTCLGTILLLYVPFLVVYCTHKYDLDKKSEKSNTIRQQDIFFGIQFQCTTCS